MKKRARIPASRDARALDVSILLRWRSVRCHRRWRPRPRRRRRAFVWCCSAGRDSRGASARGPDLRQARGLTWAHAVVLAADGWCWHDVGIRCPSSRGVGMRWSGWARGEEEGAGEGGALTPVGPSRTPPPPGAAWSCGRGTRRPWERRPWVPQSLSSGGCPWCSRETWCCRRSPPCGRSLGLA